MPDDNALAVVTTDYGAAGRTGAMRVETVCNGNIRLAVSHGSYGVSSYTSEFCTGLELPPALWRQVIADVLAKLPPDPAPPAADPDRPDAPAELLEQEGF